MFYEMYAHLRIKIKAKLNYSSIIHIKIPAEIKDGEFVLWLGNLSYALPETSGFLVDPCA